MLDDIKNLTKELDIENLSKESFFDDFLNFLITPYNQIPLTVYGGPIWIHSLIVPKKDLPTKYINSLLDWSFIPGSYSYSISSNNEYELCYPSESYDPQEILRNSTPIFLERDIFNNTDRTIEFNQEISHRLDIVESDKNHFSKMDERGDEKEVASISIDNITICKLNKNELNKYLRISNSVLIRFFDVSICKEVFFENKEKITKNYNDIPYNEFIWYDSNNEIIFRQIRGFQIVDIEPKKEQKVNYEEFLVLDYETNELKNNSCNPKCLSNFFVKSDNVHEISQVFFNRRVLSEYQNDSEKYDITNRYIECKGIWSLRYSLSDDKSQVIVYIGDLSNLPEYEQKRWKSFNEEPKSKISEHVYTTDFLGEWDKVIDPLIEMKKCLSNFPSFYIGENEYKLWEEKNKGNIRTLDNLQYIKYPTKESWELEIKKLHQILIEGFNKKNISKLSKKLDCYEKNYESLKLLKNCITSIFDEKKSEVITKPFFELNNKRIKTEHAQKNFKYPSDLINDYNFSIRNCYISMQWLSEQIDNGKFNI